MEQILPGTLDSLEPIRDYVAKSAADAGLDKSQIYKMCLAVDEIATNVITHGYDEAGLRGQIALDSGTSDGAFFVTLTDHGQPYDPDLHEQSPDADTGLALEDRRIGGLGILLARDSVDSLQYSSGPNGNTHRFVVALKQD